MTEGVVSELDGSWDMLRGQLGDVAAPELVVCSSQLELKRGRYRVHFHGEIVESGAFAVHLDALPKQLRLHAHSGNNVGRITPAIYQLAGDRLRVCFGLDGILPCDFALSHNAARYVVVYRRYHISYILQSDT